MAMQHRVALPIMIGCVFCIVAQLLSHEWISLRQLTTRTLRGSQNEQAPGTEAAWMK